MTASPDLVTRIAIIGGGFSGTMTAIRLLRMSFKNATEIVLIERRPHVGNGIAYSTTNHLHLLNVPASGMSAFPEEPDHFFAYMQKQKPDTRRQTFCRRRDYAGYLSDLLAQAQTNANSNTFYRQLPGSVIDIDRQSGQSQFTLHFQSQPTLIADVVVLAVGNFKGSDPIQKWTDKLLPDQYIYDPWANGEIEKIKETDDVLFIGSGLTMVDKALELRGNGHKGSLFALSRRGLLPAAHEEEHLKIEPAIETECAKILPMNLKEAVRFVRVKSGEGNWRDVVNALRTHCQSWWQHLETREQRSFMRHVQSYWDVHRHRMAPTISNAIHDLIASGVLQVVGGRILSIERLGSRATITFRLRQQPDTRASITVDKIVNCTGPGLNLKHIADQLLRGLVKRGLVSEHASGGLEVTSDLRSVDGAGEEVSNLYAMGSLIRGVFFESIAVPELRKQAAQIADAIFASVSKTDGSLVKHELTG